MAGFVFTLDGLNIGAGTLGQVANDPVGSLHDLISELLRLTNCVNGIIALTGLSM